MVILLPHPATSAVLTCGPPAISAGEEPSRPLSCLRSVSYSSSRSWAGGRRGGAEAPGAPALGLTPEGPLWSDAPAWFALGLVPRKEPAKLGWAVGVVWPLAFRCSPHEATMGMGCSQAAPPAGSHPWCLPPQAPRCPPCRQTSSLPLSCTLELRSLQVSGDPCSAHLHCLPWAQSPGPSAAPEQAASSGCGRAPCVCPRTLLGASGWDGHLPRPQPLEEQS